MGLQPGARLGPYEIESAIGAGGMGEVYRARDTRLGRSVAIKSLPATFARDPERVARFQREAQVLAALNHPHIAAIYGLEEVEGLQFLVLELVEGQTLAEKLAAQSQKPRAQSLQLDEALSIARQVINALEAAHEKGIVHRDLKPANIALTSDGQVKVLDFGLAKYDPLETSGVSDMTHSPTLAFAPTQAGVILGTAAYMSPEQAKGRVADKRSDVWAFGCLLFEMLTGKRAFEGEDASDTLAAILRGDPDWNALSAVAPPAIQALIKRCLTRDRRARIPDMSVVRFLMDDAVTSPVTAEAPVQSIAPQRPARWRTTVPWLAAGTLAVALIAALALWMPWRKPPATIPVRVTSDIGAPVSIGTILSTSAALSPDGTLLAFVASKAAGDDPQIYVRRLDQLQATMLPGTQGAESPFFSPDGLWIAFFAQGKLKKVSVTGGAAVTLCDAPSARGGTWGDDGSILFQPSSQTAGSVLQRVSSAGGTPEKLLSFAQGEGFQRWPQLLPGAKAVLFTSAGASSGDFENANIVVQPLPNGERKILQQGGYYGRYLPSGHLVYMHQGTLFAAPFDLDRLELTGPPAPAIEGVTSNPNTGGVQFAASNNGTVVYVPGQSTTNTVPIQWMDRTGKTTMLRSTPADWANPNFAPDGRKLAVDISDGAQTDVWVYEWDRDTLSRLTFDSTADQMPVWTPDSRRIAFASKRGDKSTFNLYWQRADGTGEAQRLTESTSNQFASSWHPSGKFLAFFEQTPQNSYDLMILPMEGDDTTGWKPGKPTVFLSSPFTEVTPIFSPDGRWIAYLSNESGRTEVYVRPFPGPGGKWQISTGGADDPVWSRTRSEIFFASADLQFMVAPYSVETDSFRADRPQLWSDAHFAARPRAPSRDIDLHPDGQRFVIAAPAEQITARQDKVVFVFNFFDELKRIAGGKR